MLVRNYAKPFCIAGIVLAEIYMLLLVLAPAGHEHHPLPAPIPVDDAVASAGSISAGSLAVRILGSAIFFGPLGALVGLGIGLLFSGFMQWLHNRRKPPTARDA